MTSSSGSLYVGMKGSFRIQITEGDELVYDGGETDNLITDLGLTHADPFHTACYLCLGAGVVTAPTYADTSLGNQVAVSSSSQSFDSFSRVSAYGAYPATYKCSKEFEFTGLDYELSELGLRRSSATGDLLTRSLIKDENGDPVTVTVTPNQTVRITYSIYSVIESAVMKTGQIVTSYGTRSYTIIPALSSESTLDSGMFALDFTVPYLTGTAYSSTYARYIFRLNGSNNNDLRGSYNFRTSDYTLDAANKQVKATISFSYIESDLTFDEITCNLSTPDKGIKIVLDSSLTLPAYYNFKLDLTTTWGRA